MSRHVQTYLNMSKCVLKYHRLLKCQNMTKYYKIWGNQRSYLTLTTKQFLGPLSTSERSKRPRLHCGKCPKPSSSCSWWIRLPPILGIEKPESITIFQFWRPAGRSRRGVKHQPIFYTSPSLSLSALQTRLLDGAIAHWSKFKVVNFIKVRILNF